MHMCMYFLLMYTDQDETACGMSRTRTSATILIGYLTEPLGPNRPRGNVKLKNGKLCVMVCGKKTGEMLCKMQLFTPLAL